MTNYVEKNEHLMLAFQIRIQKKKMESLLSTWNQDSRIHQHVDFLLLHYQIHQRVDFLYQDYEIHYVDLQYSRSALSQILVQGPSLKTALRFLAMAMIYHRLGKLQYKRDDLSIRVSFYRITDLIY
jgi:hypothetical protein